MIGNILFVLAQQQCSDYSGLASELVRISHINPGPLVSPLTDSGQQNILVTW